MTEKYTLDKVFRLLVAIGMAVCVVRLLDYLSDVLLPFACAFLLAYIFRPSIVFLDERIYKGRRVASVITTLVGTLAVCAVLGMFFTPIVGSEISRSIGVIKKVVSSADLAKVARDTLPDGLWDWAVATYQGSQLTDILSNGSVIDGASLVAEKVFPGLMNIASGALGLALGILGLTIVILYVVFLSLDYENFTSNWIKVVPPKYQKPIQEFLVDFESGMSQYFRAQAMVAAIVGVLFAVGFKIIGLPLGILLGLLIGVLNMIPYLQIAAMPPALFLAVIKALDTGGNVWGMIAITLVVFALVQIIQDTIIVPKIMGKVTGLSPAVILLSLSVWGKLLGMLGLLIALPMTVLCWAYYQRLVRTEGISEVSAPVAVEGRGA